MTAISAILTRDCIAVATDSFITRPRDGKREVVPELCGPKIVRFDRLRAAAAFWGLAELDGVSTYEWLRSVAATCQAGRNRLKLAELAELLCEDLRSRLARTPPGHRGIGIHLTGYELVRGYRIPEVFLIWNFADSTYRKLAPLDWTRRSYYDISGQEPSSWKHDPDPEERMTFRNLLNGGGFYTVNNGDPVMFNPAARAAYQMLQCLAETRRTSYAESLETWRSLVRLPIQIVADFQQGMQIPLTRVVGGRIHDLVIPHTGEPTSQSGVPAS